MHWYNLFLINKQIQNAKVFQFTCYLLRSIQPLHEITYHLFTTFTVSMGYLCLQLFLHWLSDIMRWYVDILVHVIHVLLSTLIRWVISEWSDCSKTCGRGKQERSVRCLAEVAANDFRESNSCLSKAPELTLTSQVCNQYPCPARWFIGNWSAVS